VTKDQSQDANEQYYTEE